jgi:hypothetical protein
MANIHVARELRLLLVKKSRKYEDDFSYSIKTKKDLLPSLQKPKITLNRKDKERIGEEHKTIHFIGINMNMCVFVIIARHF